MWKIFAIITLIGGLTGQGKDELASFVSQDGYATKAECELVLPEARKFWEEEIKKSGLRDGTGKIIPAQLRLKEMYCSKEEVIQ